MHPGGVVYLLSDSDEEDEGGAQTGTAPLIPQMREPPQWKTIAAPSANAAANSKTGDSGAGKRKTLLEMLRGPPAKRGAQ